MLHTLACVCLLLVGLQAAGGQNAAVAEFVSADIAAKAPARLVLRQAGFMAFISDPTIEKVVVRGELGPSCPAGIHAWMCASSWRAWIIIQALGRMSMHEYVVTYSCVVMRPTLWVPDHMRVHASGSDVEVNDQYLG
jgi:hypothetical protein